MCIALMINLKTLKKNKKEKKKENPPREFAEEAIDACSAFTISEMPLLHTAGKTPPYFCTPSWKFDIRLISHFTFNTFTQYYQLPEEES